MRFLFDLDETLVEGDLISLASAELLRDGFIDRLYTNRDVKNYDLRDLPELLRTRVFDKFADPRYVWYKYPIAGVYYMLSFLENNGHETGIVTARPSPILKETTRFLRGRFPNLEFDLGINFVNSTDDANGGSMPSKMEKLKEISPDFYFDDNVDYCIQSKNLGIETYLISNKHTPWNHQFAENQKVELDPVRVLRNAAFFPEMRIL